MTRTLFLFLQLLLLLLLSACREGEWGDIHSPEEDGCNLYFTLRINEPRTRATDFPWGDQIHEGIANEYENHIDPARLKVFIYAWEGSAFKYRGMASPTVHKGETLKDYLFTVSIRSMLGLDKLEPAPTLERPMKLKLKLIVTANCNVSAGGELGGPELGDLTFDIDPVDADMLTVDKSSWHGLPMFGTVEMEATYPTRRADDNSVDIDLLRSVAKVEIFMSEQLYNDNFRFLPSEIGYHDKWDISYDPWGEIEMETLMHPPFYFNSTGYVCPLKWDSPDLNSTGEFSHQADCFKPFTLPNEDGYEWEGVFYPMWDGEVYPTAPAGKVRNLVETDGGRRLVAYVPETPRHIYHELNGGPLTWSEYYAWYEEYPEMDSGVKIRLRYSIDGKEHASDLYFKDYMDGKPLDGTDHDIVRNHLYRFNLNGSKNHPTVSYSVCPWSEFTSGDITFN